MSFLDWFMGLARPKHMMIWLLRLRPTLLRSWSVGSLVFVLMINTGPGYAQTPSTGFLAYSAGEANVAISHAGDEYFRFGAAAWGPNWAWTGIQGTLQSEAGAAVGSLKATIQGTTLRLGFRAERIAPNRLQLLYDLKAEKDAALTLFVVEVTPGKLFEGRDVVVESQGRQSVARCPFGKQVIGDGVSALRWTDPQGRTTVMRFDPPCEISSDGAARIVLAKEQIQAAVPRRLGLTVELPAATDWYSRVADLPDEPGLAAWYPWQGTSGADDSALSMADWLDKPAGKHGRILRQGHQLLYNRQPIKLWGLNLCYSACAPDKALADKRAAFYPRYGINAVRLHKFADGAGWSGIQSKESAAEYDPAGLDRMDYQVAKFKEVGIYVKLSAHFGAIKMGPADRRDVPFLDEFGPFKPGQDRVAAPHSAFFYSRELQDLHIRQIVNLLKHRNPYTGLTYAAEPSVCALEIINEQSVFFYTSMAPLKQSATLRRQVGERFSAWLRKKYGNQQDLIKAWGERSLDGFEKDGFPAGEHLDKNNILPLGNPWYWDPQQLAGSQAYRKQRLLDTLQFLYEIQCEAYDRYVAAVRAAGYEGEIIGSNWQAGRAYSHYANLHSDARVGVIDRHNYFGGSGGGAGRFKAGSMLARPGMGLLSSGLQQVADRPFMLSEWIHVFPSEWGAEGPAILGAYGLGLQGWDVSFMFQNGDNAAFSTQLGRQAWDVMAPQVLGLFPAVARQVLRGDVQESSTLAPRRVHVPSLFEGRLGFEDQVAQGYDDKELDSTAVSARTLGAARCVIEFVDQPAATPAFELAPFLKDGLLVSSTGQLRWKESRDVAGGWFAMDTEGTKAVVGFAEGQTVRLQGVAITPRSRFAAVYVSAPDKDGRLRASKRWLITALGRARNTGMKFNPAGDELLERGRGPVLMEPIQAELEVSGSRIAKVVLLDHDGRRTEKTLPVLDGRFIVDGARDKTPYYEVILE